MSIKHPIISVTGSSGAGTSTVKNTFDQIFRREGIKAVSIEGDAFHAFDRVTMKVEFEKRIAAGDHSFSHFSYAKPVAAKPATMCIMTKRALPWARLPAPSLSGPILNPAPICCFMRACTAR